MKRWLGLATVVAAVTFATAVPAAAEPGDLDGAFGTCGFVTLGQGDLSTRTAAIVRQSGGRELVVVQDGDATEVFRLRADGSRDMSYGTRGSFRVESTFNVIQAPSDRRAWNLANDRLVLFLSTPAGNALIAVDRDGRPDPGYGTAGRIVTGKGKGAAALLSNGGFVVANATVTNGAPRFVRVTPGGVLDPTYDPLPPPIPAEEHVAILEADTADNVYAVIGDEYLSSGFEGHDIYRMTPTGLIDLTYHVEVPRPADFEARETLGATILDGTGVLVETYHYDPADLASQGSYVRRYDQSGTLDTSFADEGVLWLGVDSGVIELARRPGGGFVVTGRAFDAINGPILAFVAAFDAQGVPEPGAARYLAIGGSRADYDVDTHGVVTTNGSATFGVANGFPEQATGVVRVRFDSLRPGAALMLQWNGDAWPTRFGSDPGPECPYDTPYWDDADLARGITTVAGKGGYVVDAFGGTHRFSVGLQHPRPARAVNGPYWPGWDIVRGIAAKPDGTGGYIVDAFGAAHPFRTGSNAAPARIVGGPYWPGWDIVRGIALLPDGQRGYILDGYGGIHRFTTPGRSLPPALNHTAYWPGWDVARGISVLADGTGGYVVDAFGGAHPFGVGTHAPPRGPGPGAPYAAGEDWVRGFAFVAPMPAAGGSTPAVTAVRSDDATVRRTTDAEADAARRRTPVAGPPTR